MISSLEPLAALPGVQLVMLVTHDGVPIAVPGRDFDQSVQEDMESGSGPCQGLGREDALAAIAIGWLDELASTVGPLSWEGPRRVVLRATRGTLVMHSTKSAVLVVILARGLGHEEVRLSMEGTIGRIERGLRGMGRGTAPRGDAASMENTEPPGPLPSHGKSLRLDGMAGVKDHGTGRKALG